MFITKYPQYVSIDDCLTLLLTYSVPRRHQSLMTKMLLQNLNLNRIVESGHLTLTPHYKIFIYKNKLGLSLYYEQK